jgi:DNA polymerase-3 subunit gamma/tau
LTAGTPHQALYRRWRAQTFSEIVGQEAVVATLRNAVTTGQVAHAILFTGPRGTGKTSLARILAKALNCLDLRANGDPCDTCGPCVAIREGNTLDLVEIDAASNRGIEAIRDLRERLSYPPGELRRKVYILDEAHQITRDAWNALLKSLEEPPDFVAFMFASTHPQEFPPAILSRLQRFDVRRLTVDEISGKLERILSADGREAEPEAIGLVARLAAGGMRDAESILDQLLGSTAGRIEANAVRDLLGLADADLVDGFIDALTTGDARSGVALLDLLEERGRDLRVFLDQVVDALRARLLDGLAAGQAVDPAIASAAHRLAAIDPTRLGSGGLRLQLELALIEAPGGLAPRPIARRTAAADATGSAAPPPTSTAGTTNAEPNRPPARTPAAKPPPEAPVARPSSRPAGSNAMAPITEPPTPAPDPVPPAVVDAAPTGVVPTPVADPASPAADDPPADAARDDLDRLRHGWARVVANVTEANRAAKPLIEACRPVGVEGAMVTLGFPEEKAFLRDVAERRRPLLEDRIGDYLGHPVGVRCVATNLDLLPPLPADEAAAHILAEAQRIFAEDLADVPEVT